MASQSERELAIAQFIDHGYADPITMEIKVETVREKNPWEPEFQKAVLQWATKVLFGSELSNELKQAARPEPVQRRRNIIGGRRNDLGGSSILVTRRRV